MNRDVMKQYKNYLLQHFGANSTVIFDGNDSGPSTKDSERMKRSTKCGPDIVFGLELPIYSNQEAFLLNEDTHTHTQPFYGSVEFVRDNPGEPVPEETFTH